MRKLNVTAGASGRSYMNWMKVSQQLEGIIDTRENEDIEIFFNCMTELHCTHLKHDIKQYVKSVEVVDKTDLTKKMVDKWSIKPSLVEKLVDILLFMVDKTK